MRSWIVGLTIAVLAILAALPCLAHEVELIVGHNRAGELVVDVDLHHPVALMPSIYPGITGYATGSEMSFHSTTLDEPDKDLFQLSTAADLRFVLLAKDPGMEVWNDTGSGFMQINQMFYIGPAAFDTHPIWNIVTGTPGQVYSLTLKLIDLNHVYRDSQPIGLPFTPAVSQTATVATTTSLATSATTPSAGQPLTLTATVAPGSGTTVPSGNVTFFDGFASLGAVALNTAGVATLSSSSLAIGSHNFTASYGGSATFSSSSSTALVVQVTAAADFSISANLDSLTIAAGQSATTTLTITPLNGSTQTVTVGCGPLPPFVTCSFSPSASVTLNGSQPSTLTLTIRTNVVAALLQRIDAPRFASAGGLLGLTWLLAGLRTRRTRNRGVLLALCLGLAACGGGGGGGTGGSSGSSSAVTPPGNYTVSVTAAAGARSHPLNLTVVVQ